MNETHFSVFHSISNRARRKRPRNILSSGGSPCFQLVVLVSSKRHYDVHVTWFDRFLRRKGDSTALQLAYRLGALHTHASWYCRECVEDRVCTRCLKCLILTLKFKSWKTVVMFILYIGILHSFIEQHCSNTQCNNLVLTLYLNQLLLPHH